MRRLKIFPGDRFGKLTVIKRDETRADNRYYICKCDCGKIVSVMGKLLLNGVTRSCGCYRQELMTTHGLSRTKIYRTWSDMRSRCHNPNDTGFKNYGERGIAVCDEWRNDFVAFYEYVSKLEHFGEEGYSLDRINVNGNYEPGNLRWATDAEQRRNRTDNHYVEVGGESLIITDLSKATGIGIPTLVRRLKFNANDEQLLSKNRVDALRYEVNGEWLTIKEIAEIVGVNKTTIQSRIKHGATGEQLLKAPQRKTFLTAEERAEVKRLYIKGDKKFGAEALAKRFGCGHQTIRNILNEK